MPKGESGPFTPYTPPAPAGGDAAAARRRPPVLRYVGLGCAGLTAVLLIGFIVIGARFLSEMNRPLERTAELKTLKDTPIYIGAEWDEEVTRLGRGTLAGLRAFVPARDYTAQGFRTRATADAVLSFYDRKMVAQGYKPVALGNSTQEGQVAYGKERTLVVVQAFPDQSDPDVRRILVMRLDGTTRRLDDKDEGGSGTF
jgi:hypothetical protein